MAFSGLFLRHFMGDQPGFSGTASGLSDSPDIILEGTSPVDPSTLATPASYSQEPPNILWVGSKATNYVYVRALNTTGGPVDGRLWLWYAEPAMLNWPQNWISAGFVVDGQNQNWVNVHAASPNRIAVGDAFAILSPDTPKDHYCMIAISETQQETPPQPPFPGYMRNLDDFVAWVARNQNVAWRNTADQHVSGPGACWNWASPIPGPEQGPATFNVGIQCQNMPVNSQYQFTVPGGQNAQGSWPSLDSGKRTIGKPNEAYTLQTTWPGGVTATMNITWWANGTTPELGATIVPYIGVSTSGLDAVLDDPMAGAAMVEVQTDHRDKHSLEIQFQHIIGAVPLRLLAT
jgi:hypothetical protein